MWYAVDVLTKSSCVGSNSDGLWEESIYLIDARDQIEAECKSKEIITSEKCEYQTQTGETVKWEFDSILSVYEILDDQIASGSELFSRFLRKEEVESLKTPFADEP